MPTGSTPALVLASSSPRRAALLALFGVTFRVEVPSVDETPLAGEPARDYVARLAREKAAAVLAPGAVVLGADTAIELDGAIVGKPADDRDVRTTLHRLAGRTHLVHTGVALLRLVGGEVVVAADGETTAVRFAALTDEDIEWYLGTGESQGKAGSYALQGVGSVFVTEVVGSISNVIGLPLEAVRRLLAAR
jgi:septum formation protein